MYYSTNSGTAWGYVFPWGGATPVGTEYVWSFIASSADGTKLAVTATHLDDEFGYLENGYVFTSTNSGASWIGTNGHTGNIFPVANWSAAAMSADGIKIVTVATNGLIYTSTNSGTNCKSNAVPALNWTSVASSADGTKLVALANNGSIYNSANSGTSWSASSISGVNWTAVASSADGTRLVAVSANGAIYVSTNSGGTWQLDYMLASGGWSAVASSADGNKLVATAANGGIYTKVVTSAPTLHIATSGNNLIVSWTTPSASFQLQQILNYTATNWTAVTNSPVLNLTNLQYQVALPSTNHQAFFRLTAQ